MRKELRTAAKSIALASLNAAHRPVAARGFRREVAINHGAAKVSVGGGPISLPGWINTDIDYRAEYYLDLMKPWPVDAGAVAHVYGDNVIEHFPLAAVRVVLRHAYDALTSGGAIRLATPDVGRVAEGYLNKTDLAHQFLDRHRRHGYTVHHLVDLLRVTFAEAGHHEGYCFDYETLAAELRNTGFVDVHREEAGESSIPAFKGLEGRTEPTERAFALVVEGTKPS